MFPALTPFAWNDPAADAVYPYGMGVSTTRERQLQIESIRNMSSCTRPPALLGSRRAWLRRCLAPALVLLLLAHDGQAAPKTKSKKVDHVTVQAFADRQAVTPGGTLHLIASLKMDKDWYVYWQATGGELGLPTEIQWSAPTGYRIGRVRFPVPERKFDKTLKTVTYTHDGTLLVLTSMQVPSDATVGKDATFTLKAAWLACKKACVPGEAKLSLTLPVVAEASDAPPANLSLFEEAGAGLPLPTTQAEHHTLSVTADKAAVKPGDTFTVTVTTTIEAKHHMQSSKPLVEGLIPAVVFVERTAGLEFGDVVYPKPHVRDDKVLGKMSEYGGEVAFKIPVTVEDDADTSPRWIRGILQSQICTESGTCYPPQHVEFAIPVRMVGGPAPTPAKAIPLSGTEAAKPGAAPPDKPETAAATSDDRNFLIRAQDYLLKFGFFGIIVLAFCGGFLLNLMPCVLPVISLKVLSFVRQAHEDRWRVFRLGLTYAAGIMVFYGVLAALFYTTGRAWGELFQEPLFVIVTAAVILAFSLSLFGVFAVFTPNVVNELGQKAEAQEGYLSAFGTGILATLLGTACTAPFLSVAIGYATQLPAAQGAWIFAVAGLGMAFPFIVLTYNPTWLRFVPRPGPWMGTFEHIMGFLLLATVIWLVNPLRSQLGSYGLLLSLIFLLAVAIAVWIKGKIVYGDPVARRIKLYAMALSVLVIGWMLPFRALSSIPALMAEVIEHEDLLTDGQICRQQRHDTGPVTWTGWQDTKEGIPWQRYRRDRALRFVNAGYTVFVDYTADWCASCKTNLKTSIDVEATIKTMRELNVVPFEADYTLKRPEIKKDLTRFNSAGVPLYLVYRPHDTDNPEKLPEILTPGMVINALKRAGPSRPADPGAS